MKLHDAALALLALILLAGQGASAQTIDTQTWNGITVKCSKVGYGGLQEEGLEIVNIDSSSPAAAVGLHGPVAATPAAMPRTFLDRLKGVVVPQALPGDLIVAINYHRVRCESDLEKATANVKPGDTVSLVIIRSLPDAQHTAKVNVKVGERPKELPALGPSRSP